MPCSACSVRRYAVYGAISDEGLRRVSAVRKGQLDLRKGHLIAAGTKSDPFVYSVTEGWAYSFALLRDGRRQILDFFTAGDLIMFPDIQAAGVQVGVRCLTNVTVCQFEKRQLFDVLSESREMSGCLMTYFEKQKSKFENRLIELGVLAAEEAVASLIYSVLRRLRERGHEGGMIKFPLRLNEIAESVGITSIHAGRVMRDLEKREVIQRGPGDMLLINEDQLMRILSPHGDILN